MNKAWLCLILVLASITQCFSQTISKTWQASENQENLSDNSIFNGNTLGLKEGAFSLSNDQDTLAEGDYIYQNKVLLFFYNTPKDSTANYRLTALTDSSLVLSQ